MSTDEPRSESFIGVGATGTDDLAERSHLVHGFEILGSDPEPAWDSLARVAAALVEMPVALVSWFDGSRLWFKARVGFPFESLPLQGTMCGRTLLSNATTVIPDLTADPQFASSLAVVEMGARTYAGVPIHAPGRGVAIGTLCVMDKVARHITPEKIGALEGLGKQAEALLELRREKRRIEKARRAQVTERKRLEATLDAAAVGVFVTGIPDRPDYGNPALERILRRSSAELAVGWHIIVHPDDLSIPARWEESALAVPPRPMEYRVRAPDGSLIWVRNHMAPIRDGEARTGWIGTITDITEQKTLEARLRATEERLEFAIAVGEHGVWDWDLVTNGCIFSDSWFSLFGVDRSSARPHVETWRTLVHPEDLPRCLAQQQAHIRGETPLYQIEYRFRRGDEWRWIFARGKVVARAPDGTALRMVGTNMDITPRRRAEDEVRRLAERLLHAESIAELGHWTSNRQSGELDWSPHMYELFGRDPALGPPTRDEASQQLVAEDAERMHREVAIALRAGRPWSVEYRMFRPDGEMRHMCSRGVMRVEPDGSTWFDGTEQDITEYVRAREAMQHAKELAEVASRAKADFLATISHEIRTPLNGVLGMAELLRETELTPEQRAFVDVARASGDWLLALVSDVLDFSKIDAERIELAPHPFSLRTLVEDVAGVVAESAQKKGLELWVDVAPGVPLMLSGDTQRLRQIVLNLVANAVKFTEVGDVAIAVHATVAGEVAEVRLTVRDTGPGIAPGLHAHVFEPFVQGDLNKRQSGASGTGLGLAIAQRLAGHMGGAITVTSSSGEGATFCLSVPLPVVQQGGDERAPPRVRDGLQLLLVNAHPGVTEALRTMLVSAGARVRVARDVEEARDAIAVEAPDVVVCDGNVGTAFHPLARELREAGVPVVLAAAVSDRAQVPTGLFSSLLVKPLRLETLVEVVTQLAEPHVKVPTAPRPRVKTASFEGARVLIAEDNRVNAFLLRALLERLGCRVDAVEDGSAAIVAVLEGSYDLVFMDCIMADMDGYAATAAIRYAERGRRVPIVAVTASAIEGDRERCLAAGMDDYLTKPITGEAIAAALKRWMSKNLDE